MSKRKTKKTTESLYPIATPRSESPTELPAHVFFEFGGDTIRVSDYEDTSHIGKLPNIIVGVPAAPDLPRTQILTLLSAFGIKGETPQWELCG